MSRAERGGREPETYKPDSRLVDLLNEELQYVKTKDGKASAGGTKKNVSKRNKKSKSNSKSENRVSRRKSYRIDKLFEEFADITYFLKFIDEHHDELGEIYGDVLEQFFGVLRPNPIIKKVKDGGVIEVSKQPKPAPMFDEFIKGSLSLRSLHAKSPIDFGFRIHLINIMIRNATTALQFLMSNSRMLPNMLQDSNRFSSYPEMLEEGFRETLEKQDRKIWRTYKI